MKHHVQVASPQTFPLAELPARPTTDSELEFGMLHPDGAILLFLLIATWAGIATSWVYGFKSPAQPVRRYREPWVMPYGRN